MVVVKAEVVGRVSGLLDIPAPVSRSLATGEYVNVTVEAQSVLEGFPDIAALISSGDLQLTEVSPAVPPASSAVKLGELNAVDSALSNLAIQAIAAVQTDMSALEQAFGSAVEGDAVMSLLYGTAAEDVSAAELNAAAAGEFSKPMAVSLKNADGIIHGWANFAPTVTPAVVAADGDIGVPTVYAGGTGTVDAPKFSSGQLPLDVIFDTDAGATKTYQVGDVVTVTVDVSAISLLAGVGNFVKTYNVIA